MRPPGSSGRAVSPPPSPQAQRCPNRERVKKVLRQTDPQRHRSREHDGHRPCPPALCGKGLDRREHREPRKLSGLAKAPGVKFVRMDGDRAVLEVEAGRCRFAFCLGWLR